VLIFATEIIPADVFQNTYFSRTVLFDDNYRKF